MITVKSLRPDPQPSVPWPQCSARVGADDTINWRRGQISRNARDPSLCKRNATVEIDGKPLCATHGGKVALAMLLEGEKR